MRRLLLNLFLVLFASVAVAQTSSPRINPDGSVTFTYQNQDAEEVTLKGDVQPDRYTAKSESGKSLKLKSGENGIWSLTVPALEPDLYMYAFEVEEVLVDEDEEEDVKKILATDAANPLRVRDVNDYYSAFIYPGEGAEDLVEDASIAHGTILQQWYKSTIKDQDRRRMMVYLPPSYESNPQTRYPVLYLFHGTGGDENAWMECGRSAQILDNLIAQKKVSPMIVVMPNCDASMDAAPGHGLDKQAENNSNNLSSMFGRFESSFVTDIVKYVDNHFRTIANKSHRAVAGLSLGGMQTLYISINNPDLCSYIGLFSAQTEPYFSEKMMGNMSRTAETASRLVDKLVKALPFLGDKLSRKADDFEANVENLDIYKDREEKIDALFSKNPRLFYIACGKDDFVITMNDDLRDTLTKGGHPFVYNESEGGHTWSNWRHYLMDFLPRLWK